MPKSASARKTTAYDMNSSQRDPPGSSRGGRADVVATAKRPLKRGEVLDGEGGFCVWGKQMPADRSLKDGLLPLGLAHTVTLRGEIAEGESLKWSDVRYDENDFAVKVRREMEATFGWTQPRPLRS